MSAPFVVARAGAMVVVLMAGAAAEQGKPSSPKHPAKVVFVCQHGNVKSVIAAQWFGRLAAERGLPVRAVSRGVEPETPVPAAIADHLGRDGFDVQRFSPRALSLADLEGASRLVMIGVEPPAWMKGKEVPVERWEGIPPASTRYEASRDAIRSRIVALLAALSERGRNR